MREVVLDASVVLKWFGAAEEDRGAAGRALRAAYEDGRLRCPAPSLLALEVLNVAGRRRGWDRDALATSPRHSSDCGSISSIRRWSTSRAGRAGA